MRYLRRALLFEFVHRAEPMPVFRHQLQLNAAISGHYPTNRAAMEQSFKIQPHLSGHFQTDSLGKSNEAHECLH